MCADAISDERNPCVPPHTTDRGKVRVLGKEKVPAVVQEGADNPRNNTYHIGGAGWLAGIPAQGKSSVVGMFGKGHRPNLE